MKLMHYGNKTRERNSNAPSRSSKRPVQLDSCTPRTPRSVQIDAGAAGAVKAAYEVTPPIPPFVIILIMLRQK